MKRIIFHIGTPKTATTAIQNTLAANRDALRKKGVLYPATDRPPFPNHHKHNSLFKAVSGSEFEAERNLILSEFEASGCHTMVLSAEGLSGVPLDRLGFLRQLAQGFETQTVCFLRRQDLFLESWWNQRVKRGDEADSVEMFYRQEDTQFRIRYDRFLLDGWASFSTVSPVNFDQVKRNGVVTALTKICDLPALEEPKPQNISPSANCAVALMEVNRAGVAINKKQLMRAFQDDSSKHVLGRRLRREILDEVAEGNQRLEAKYGVRFETDLPDEPEQPMISPDPQAVAQAMAWLSVNEKGDEKEHKEDTGAQSRPKSKRQLLAALFSMISDTRQESGQARLVIRAPNSEKQENKVVDRAQEAPAVPAAVKLARAIWREETRAEKLSKEDRLARWQEVKKDRVRMAKRALKHLNDSGLSFVETGTSEA